MKSIIGNGMLGGILERNNKDFVASDIFVNSVINLINENTENRKIADYFNSIDFSMKLKKLVNGAFDSNVESAIIRKTNELIENDNFDYPFEGKIQNKFKEIVSKYETENFDDIIFDPKFEEMAKAKLTQKIERFVEKSGSKAVLNHLNSEEVEQNVREQLLSAIRSLMEDSDVVNAIREAIESHADEHLETLVDAKLETKLEELDLAAFVGQQLDEYAKSYIDEHFPHVIRLEDEVESGKAAGKMVHKKFKDVLKACRIPGANILMVGPAGAGKTQIAMQVAEYLKQPFYFNGPIHSEYKLLGFLDANGNYKKTPFYSAFTGGGVYLFDEVDASSPQAVVAFNTAIANRVCDFPHHPEPEKQGQPVHADKSFKCFAAANTYGRGANYLYTARTALDAATLDRFIVIEIDYDEGLELLFAGVSPWVQKIQGWRRNMIELAIPHTISMRATQRGEQLLKAGFSEEEVEEMVVWRGLDRNSVSKIKG